MNTTPGYSNVRSTIRPTLPHLVWMEDVILRLHRRMACISAIREACGVGSKLARCGFIIEHRVSPAPRPWKPLAVLFHDEHLFENVRYFHDERSLRAQLVLPLQLHDHGAIRKFLAVAGHAAFVCAYHLRIGDDPVVAKTNFTFAVVILELAGTVTGARLSGSRRVASKYPHNIGESCDQRRTFQTVRY